MKIDLTLTITDLAGREIRESADQPPLTLGAACITAFTVNLEGDMALPLAEKVSTYKLACKLAQAGDEVDLPVEDVAAIKKRIGRAFHHVVVGAVVDLLEEAANG